MKRLLLFLLVSQSLLPLAEAQIVPPKREFRGAWIATVVNLDWPSNRTYPPSTQRAELTTLLDKLKAIGINVVVFQVRPECDALYQSSIEPWSYYLTGAQGMAPNPVWDPLQFAIDEAHKRGMELHAWFNPYRAIKKVGAYSIAPGHVSQVHPEWTMQFALSGGGYEKLLDPGIPEVRDYDLSVIMDVVRRYDVDGIHWDDYFYSYSGISNQDSASWRLYNRGFSNIADWRRDNVNLLVQAVHDSIQAVKPWVKFGISPFGIWKNGIPSGISGMSAYDDIYCDAVTWMSHRWLDYLSPQLYWAFGGGQDYGKLMPWWSLMRNGRHLYPGQAAYRIKDVNWGSSELPNQIRLDRTNGYAQGSLFFRAAYGVVDNPKGFADSLKNDLYKYPAIMPAMTWKDSVPPLPPVNLMASEEAGRITLTWSNPPVAADGETASHFVVYRADSTALDPSDPRQIRLLTPFDSTGFVDSVNVKPYVKYTYLVTSLDRLWNESDTTAKVTFTITGVGEEPILASDFSLEQNYPNPFNPTSTIVFTLNTGGRTTLKVYDLLGREVSTLVDDVVSAGRHSVAFNGSNLASGVYFYRLTSGSFSAAKKMILQK